MREGLLGWPGAAARPAGHALGAMDMAGMDVGAEIELTEDGSLEELPLHLENAKNCLSWETLDASSSDDDGEAYFTFYLPARRPPRPAQRLPAQRPPASPSAAWPATCAKWIPPLYPCTLRPSLPAATPGSPALGAHQCQKCLQVFMEEWHYAQHLKDHAQEEAQKPAAPPPRARSPPRKLRCLECGKRFLHPEHFARHTKWHLKLVRKGIKVCHRKGSRRCSSSSSSSSPSSQAAYVYKPAETQLGAKGTSSLPAAQDCLRQPKSLQAPRAQKASKRKAPKHQRKLPTAGAPPTEGLLSPAHPGHSVAILDGDIGVALLQPWQKQEAILEGQVAGGLFQPAVMNADNQIIILDGDEAEVQATIFDGQGNVNALRPLFLRAEEQAAILDAPVSLSSLQLGGVKDQASLASGWVSQNPCALYRTVLLQADEQAAVMDGQVEPSPLQQVIIKTSEGASTLYLDPDPHLSSVDLATLHLVPLHQEPQYITVPYGNALTLDNTETVGDADKAWEQPQTTTVQFSGYMPNQCQQNKQLSPPATASLSPKGPVVVRLVPSTSGDHPEVLDLEYDTGGGIPVASEPWEANGKAGPEAYGAEEVAAEEDFIIVEVDPDSRGPKMAAVGRPLGNRRRRASRKRVRKPARRIRTVWGFRCPDCGARYSRKSQLRAHQKWPRRRGRVFLCECGTSFRGLLHLLRHQLQHLEEALFICAACGKSLKGHTDLARHGSCHPHPAHFSCPCGASFQRLSRYLWHHVRNQRPGLRVYTLSGFLPSS